MIADLDERIKKALLSSDKQTAETLRMLKSALQLQAKETGGDLSEEDALSVIRKQIKQRNDSAEAFAKAGNSEMEQKELAEAALYEEFMPKQLSDDELNKLIDEAVEALGVELSRPTMGQVIGAVSDKAGPSSSKSDIARVINSRL